MWYAGVIINGYPTECSEFQRKANLGPLMHLNHYESLFNSTRYLERINCNSSPKPTFEFLKEIHNAQLYTIPFENFDICLNRVINLEPAAIFEKLVRKARGGYCFELNGLFLMALKSFGFDARALLGRVHITGVPTGRGHQVSLVTIDGNQWILDVGFGAETPQVPIPLRFNQPITCEGQILRLVESEHSASCYRASTMEIGITFTAST